MKVEFLQTILRDSEGETYRFGFLDGTEMLAEVVSATHVDEDDTVMLIRVGALPNEPGWQVNLTDICSIEVYQQ
jgi:hypothetical protein